MTLLYNLYRLFNSIQWKMTFKTLKTAKRLLSTFKYIPRVCIVGAGPAGFYAAMHLKKKLNAVEIDIIEKLPVPFGLVR